MRILKYFFLFYLLNTVNSYNSIPYIKTITNNNNHISNINELRRKILYFSLSSGLSRCLGINNIKPVYGYTSAYDTISDTNKINILNYIEKEQDKLYDDAIPSVCYISTEYTSMGEKFNLNKEDLPKGVGSGFVWDDEGHIITNFHVINKVDNAKVTITKKIKNK